jgi:CubicO group peptidase (beta-lactamase class C family)
VFELLTQLPEFFAGFLKRHPVVPTASRPVYSNAAFQILAYAMENITGQDYQSLLKNRLIEPLNLARSYYNPPDPKYGAIPGDIASSDWNISAGEQTP